MGQLLIIANWKSNKTKKEANNWLKDVFDFKKELEGLKDKEIIICPSFTLLSCFKSSLEKNNFPFKLGAQNVSQFDKGAYTGEINAEQIREFAEFVIIGHSERRENFGEEDDALLQKVEKAIKNSLKPIFCVQDAQDFVPKEVKIVAYEPVFAIGSGKPDTPKNANEVAEKIMEKNSNVEKVIYGGSVNSENVNSFTKKDMISGVLVGGASLDPREFIKIINNV